MNHSNRQRIYQRPIQIDRKRINLQKRKKISFLYYRLPWLLLLGMAARTTIFVRQRSTDLFAAIDPSALVAILFVSLSILTILINPRMRHSVKRLLKSSTLFLLLYYLLCVLSCFWSLRPEYTAFRAVEVVATIGLIFVVLSYTENFFDAERTYLRFSLMMIVLSILMHIKFGGISLGSLHTNVYSVIAGMGFVYCYAERFNAHKQRRKMLTRYLMVFLFFLAIGTSAGSNIAVAVGVLVSMMIVGRRNGVIILFFFIAVVLLYIIGQFEDFWMQILLPNKDMHDITTFSGRSNLWEEYLRLFEDKPFIGYGFSVVSRLGGAFGTVSSTNAHNGFFEVVLGTGLCGGLFFLFWLVRLGAESFRSRRKRLTGSTGFISALTVVIVNNMSKSIIGGAFDPTLVAFLFLLAFFICHIKPLSYLNWHRRDENRKLSEKYR